MMERMESIFGELEISPFVVVQIVGWYDVCKLFYLRTDYVFHEDSSHFIKEPLKDNANIYNNKDIFFRLFMF